MWDFWSFDGFANYQLIIQDELHQKSVFNLFKLDSGPLRGWEEPGFLWLVLRFLKSTASTCNLI